MQEGLTRHRRGLSSVGAVKRKRERSGAVLALQGDTGAPGCCAEYGAEHDDGARRRSRCCCGGRAGHPGGNPTMSHLLLDLDLLGPLRASPDELRLWFVRGHDSVIGRSWLPILASRRAPLRAIKI